MEGFAGLPIGICGAVGTILVSVAEPDSGESYLRLARYRPDDRIKH
jgi:hypothetical protein